MAVALMPSLKNSSPAATSRERDGFDLLAATTPLGFAGGDTNLYRYVANNPLVNVDPTGLCREGGNDSGGGKGDSSDDEVPVLEYGPCWDGGGGPTIHKGNVFSEEEEEGPWRARAAGVDDLLFRPGEVGRLTQG